MMKKNYLTVFLLISLAFNCLLYADDGYRLWLKYDPISNQKKLQTYKNLIKGWMTVGEKPTIAVVRNELKAGLEGLLGTAVPQIDTLKEGIVIVGKYQDFHFLEKVNLKSKLKNIGHDGFIILSTTLDQKKVILITAMKTKVFYMVFFIS